MHLNIDIIKLLYLMMSFIVVVEELIGSANQNISDVADVQATFGGAEPDNLG
jgi:hypothetical protein